DSQIPQPVEWNGDGGLCRESRNGGESLQRRGVLRNESGREDAASVQQKSRSLLLESAAHRLRTFCPPFVPRAPSLELYVLPIGGGQLLQNVLHIKTSVDPS